MTTSAALIWLALLGVVVATPILYWPRRFSGPLTRQERRMVRGALRWRSRALLLATPALTVVGLVLLLPPSLHLTVAGRGGDAGCEAEAPKFAPLARSESTAGWVEAVRCHARGPGAEELAEAIVDAARDGFRAPLRCREPRLSATDLASIELSLVEVAARAYDLSAVELDPGPRFTDPDPWDIMQGTLRARGIPTCRSAENSGEREAILRLGPALVADPEAAHHLEVDAVVHGKLCGAHSGREPVVNAGREPVVNAGREPVVKAGRLEDRAGTFVEACQLTSMGPNECSATGQRVVRMHVTCGARTRELLRAPGRSALRLLAGYGQAHVHQKLPVALRFAPSAQELTGEFERVSAEGAFTRDLHRRGLELPGYAAGVGVGIEVRQIEDDIIVTRGDSGGSSTRVDDLPELMLGPFSWSGVANVPMITCSEDQVRIAGGATLMVSGDPTAQYATVNTIVWAANVLTTRSCAGGRALRDSRGSRPLLGAEQIEACVAALRRGRETSGLVCLALALVALALGLRRSTT